MARIYNDRPAPSANKAMRPAAETKDDVNAPTGEPASGAPAAGTDGTKKDKNSE